MEVKILTAYLVLLTLTGIFKIGGNKPTQKRSTSGVIGTLVGHITKFLVIFWLLWQGGFYT